MLILSSKSSDLVTESGFPISQVSRVARTVRFFSTRSASLYRSLPRSAVATDCQFRVLPVAFRYMVHTKSGPRGVLESGPGSLDGIVDVRFIGGVDSGNLLVVATAVSHENSVKRVCAYIGLMELRVPPDFDFTHSLLMKRPVCG